MKFYQHTLKNGLTILGEQRENALSSAIAFFVRTGSRDETNQLLGVSHFLEHMMFKGTARRTALEINYALGDIGAQANAYTTEENTVFYVSLLPEYFDRGMELLCDMLRPSLDKNEFDTEKKVILEEIALYQDRPTHVLFETALREYFGLHPAGNPVLGTTDTIGPLLQEQMLQYFEQRYVPSNMVLGASGNFDWPRFIALAEQYCAHWVNRVCDRTVASHTPKELVHTILRENLQRAHLTLFAPGPSATDRDRYPVNVLCSILGDSSGSRTYWELIDQGLADSASIDSDELEGTGLIMGYLSSDPDRLDEVGEILSRIMKTPKEFHVDDLERAKTKLGTALVLQGESTLRRLMTVGSDWLYRKEYLPLTDELLQVKKVTPNDIYSALERFSFSPVTTVKLIPA